MIALFTPSVHDVNINDFWFNFQVSFLSFKQFIGKIFWVSRDPTCAVVRIRFAPGSCHTGEPGDDENLSKISPTVDTC